MNIVFRIIFSICKKRKKTEFSILSNIKYKQIQAILPRFSFPLYFSIFFFYRFLCIVIFSFYHQSLYKLYHNTVSCFPITEWICNRRKFNKRTLIRWKIILPISSAIQFCCHISLYFFFCLYCYSSFIFLSL